LGGAMPAAALADRNELRMCGERQHLAWDKGIVKKRCGLRRADAQRAASGDHARRDPPQPDKPFRSLSADGRVAPKPGSA
jgi:hypothetical protein